ncbi:methyltransferase type 12 [Streptomyces kronopolitis]|uniref:Methyltransferase type 12 n=1 Tax=Streptomyces kronopolitis TaxID=1612435 RepID=A0ABQ2JS39_9ACTN|nr:hypothetical protein [Streptomyces kronopolitis]GGN52980.1 methyltransferase type 12 [Streptomyces kronopolitis]
MTPSGTRGRTSLTSVRCERCGFTSEAFHRREVPAVLRACAGQWRTILDDPHLSRQKTGPLGWSPLEYGCHARDMCVLFHRRLITMLRLPPVRRVRETGRARGEAELLTRYSEEDPRQVAPELGWAAESLACRFETFTSADWGGRDPRSGAPGLSVELCTEHFIHDLVHDLSEVARLKAP